MSGEHNWSKDEAYSVLSSTTLEPLRELHSNLIDLLDESLCKSFLEELLVKQLTKENLSLYLIFLKNITYPFFSADSLARFVRHKKLNCTQSDLDVMVFIRTGNKPLKDNIKTLMKSGLIYFDRIKKVKSRGTYNSRALKSMPFKTNFPRLFIRYNKNTSHPEFMHPSSLTWSQEMTIAFLENYLMHDQMKVFSYHAEESNKKHKKKPALIRSEYYILKERINRLFEFLGIEPQNLGTLLDLSELKSELTNRSEGILIARQLRDELLEKDLSKTTTENIPYELPEGEQYLSERLDELFRDISFKDLRIKLPNEVKRHGKGRKD